MDGHANIGTSRSADTAKIGKNYFQSKIENYFNVWQSISTWEIMHSVHSVHSGGSIKNSVLH